MNGFFKVIGGLIPPATAVTWICLLFYFDSKIEEGLHLELDRELMTYILGGDSGYHLMVGEIMGGLEQELMFLS